MIRSIFPHTSMAASTSCSMSLMSGAGSYENASQSAVRTMSSHQRSSLTVQLPSMSATVRPLMVAAARARVVAWSVSALMYKVGTLACSAYHRASKDFPVGRGRDHGDLAPPWGDTHSREARQDVRQRDPRCAAICHRLGECSQRRAQTGSASTWPARERLRTLSRIEERLVRLACLAGALLLGIFATTIGQVRSVRQVVRPDVSPPVSLHIHTTQEQPLAQQRQP